MKGRLATLCLYGSGMLSPVLAQDSLHAIGLNETVISAGKFEENKKNIAQAIQVITRKQIEWMMPQTSATLLEQTGNVFVQRSQAGGGSPVLRGFEASRVLLVVDGVRLNNAIYRAGHLQNVITIDNNILDRVEVLYGPSSTLYGSDALGGVVLFNTRKPQLSQTGKMAVNANAMIRYSSAYDEQTAHADINLGFKNFASLTSVTAGSFGDLRQGANRGPDMDSLGLRYSYVTRINGVDSIVNNPDPEKQIFSGYDQMDVLQKFLYRQSDKLTHQLNLQYSNSTNIPRYDRLTETRSGKLRFAEWYYGPQLRTLAGYRLEARKLNGIVDEINAGANYQMIEESRYQRNRGSNDLQARIEKLNVIGYNIDLRRKMGGHELIVGTDGQYNHVNSEAYNRNLATEAQKPLDTRYPSGGSTMFYGAIYGQHIYKIIDDKLVLNDGVRLNYVDLETRFADKTFFPFPYDDASQQHLAASGNLGLVYMPVKGWRLTANGATGFRAPNVDDLAKVFESAGGGMLMVPNPDLKPEHTYNIDLGISYAPGDRFKVEVTGFHAWFRNAIVTDGFRLNGEDSIMYGGKMTAIMASQNKASAKVHGFSAAATVGILKGLSLYSAINYTYGRYKGLSGAAVPLDHIPPVFGKTSLVYTAKGFTGEFFALYNGWKRVKDYSPSGEDNLIYATAAGMPAWYTLNIRAGYIFSSYLGAELAVENILDRNYRVFASGISAPGRNIVVTLRSKF